MNKKKRTKSKISKIKEIIKIRAKVSEVKNRRIIEQINKTKNWVSLKR
jgi:hypothetical protein